MEFKDLIINFLIAGVIVISFTTWAGLTAYHQGGDPESVKDDRIDFEGIEEKVNDINEASKAWEQAIKSDNVFIAGVLILASLWKVMVSMWGFAIEISEIIFFGVGTILGIPTIILASLTAILILTFIFIGWREIKS